jgi:peptide/nickel transport system substrate-binding protein
VLSFVTTHESPLKNVLVRRALNLAVDRTAIIATLLAGAVTPASQGATRGAYGYDTALKPFEYNPDEAKRLLIQAGYGNGFSFVLEVVAGSSANDTAIVQRIAQDLEKIGVHMRLRQVPLQEFLRDAATGNWVADAFVMVYPSVPPFDALRPLRIHSCLRPAAWFCDPTIMPAINAAFSEFDPAKQIAERHALMAWERDQVPALFLWEDVRFGGVANGAKNFGEVNGFIDYDRITLAR